jgi:hypothetical protein
MPVHPKNPPLDKGGFFASVEGLPINAETLMLDVIQKKSVFFVRHTP